jgi:hypothetical protein
LRSPESRDFVPQPATSVPQMQRQHNTSTAALSSKP